MGMVQKVQMLSEECANLKANSEKGESKEREWCKRCKCSMRGVKRVSVICAIDD